MGRNIVKYSLLFITFALLLAACPGSDAGEEMAMFSIDLGGGGNSRAVYPPGTADEDSPAISTLTFRAVFTSENAEPIAFTSSGNDRISGSIATGTYTVTVSIFYSSGALYARGSTTYTVVSGSNTITVAVHKVLSITLIDYSDTNSGLSPLDSVTLNIGVYGFINDTDADKVHLTISGPGLTFSGHNVDGNATEGAKIFNVKVGYDGTTQFEGSSLRLNVTGLDNLPTNIGYTYTILLGGSAGTGILSPVLYVNDGDASKDRPVYTPAPSIPVTQENIERFNAYANTPAGLDKHYWLMEPIDLTGITWAPIGSETTPFTGSFDGGDWTIENLAINSTTNYQGMFGYIDGGSVINLGLADCDITGSYNVGGIAGFINNGMIEKCYVTGSIVGIDFVGGIVGFTMTTNSTTAAIINCYTAADVTGLESVGGVVGFNANDCTVKNCYAIGPVGGSNNHVGGIVGLNQQGTIQNCVALNTDIIMSLTNTDYGRVAGSNSTLGILLNNYGREPMNFNGAPGTAWTDADNGNDGGDITTVEYNTFTWWRNSANWDITNSAAILGDFYVEGIWDWNNTTNLPILTGFTAAQNHTVP
jgi:hypothetical protein